MSTFRLPDGTHIGHVHLQVSNLDRSLRFYSDLLGFQEVKREGRTAFLSASGQPPYHIVLTEIPNAQPKPPRTTGLYHVAIRLPNRRELTRVFKRLVDRGWRFHGFSDHKVSEAIYLPDPDDNGLELYRDKPRDTWQWRNGNVYMTTESLDVDALLRTAEADTRPRTGIHPDTDIGHVHLHVAALKEAEHFYHDLLGLDVTLRGYPGALFFAVGGYHHHLGANTWAGTGAPPPPPDAVGLHYFTLCLPDETALEDLAAHLMASDATFEEKSGTLLLRDPSQNGVVVTAEEAPETTEMPAAEVTP